MTLYALKYIRKSSRHKWQRYFRRCGKMSVCDVERINAYAIGKHILVNCNK